MGRGCTATVLLVIDMGTGVSGQRHAPVRALPPGKGPIVQEAGWDPEQVWKQRLQEKSFVCQGSKPSRPVCSRTPYRLSYPSCYTLATLAFCFSNVP
jgi:hypothetical protein